MTDSTSHSRPDWLKIAVSADKVLHDALSEFLMETLGCNGVVIDESPGPGVTAYLPGETDPETLRSTLEVFLARLKDLFPNAGPCRVTLELIQDPDWRVAWRAYFHAEQVTPGLLVLPSWEPPPARPQGRILLMDPGPAFGTGQHASTRLCLQALEDLAPESPWDLLDVGTGSGILAIYGVMLGASPVAAMDIDEEALQWAEWNIALNGLQGNIRLSADPLPAWDESFSVVTANLILDVILDLLPCFPRVVRPGGHLVLSGLLTDQVGDVTPHLERLGFVVRATREQGEWACVLAQAHTGFCREGSPP